VCSLGSALLRERRSTFATSQRVERGVDGDAVEPREEVRAAVELRQTAERFDECLLRRVIGIAVIAEDMQCSGVHASLMAPNKATESFSVTIASPIQVGVLVTHR
jgi:hypothetical protein